MNDKSNELRRWTIKEARSLYQVRAWGAPYFDINKRGNVEVSPLGEEGGSLDLFPLVEDLRRRGYELPLLLRFSEILKHRVARLCGAFESAIAECDYGGSYRAVYPIKVNQQKDVVEELLEFGRPYKLGLEAGSKPELLIALAYTDDPDAVIVCNGYKDRAYVETALLAQKLGRFPIIVIDRFEELEMVVSLSRKLNLRPHIGVRAKLASRGAGKWTESGGQKSKFGLNASELVAATDHLREVGMLDCLEMLHFHIGSQVTAIRAIKDALRESCRIFVELCNLGAGLRLLDVGGGLAVDYDGSKTTFHSSTNYTLEEYARDVVSAIQVACDEKDIPHPQIISESGRAMVAHHSILVFDVLGVSEVTTEIPSRPTECEQIVSDFYDTLDGLSSKNFQESFHDALELRDEAQSLFSLGYLDLKGRALVENCFWGICQRIDNLVRDLDYVPEELEGLERALADTYYCNFSIFQSVPDHWAVKQLFPAMPLQRLNEKPTRRAILADLTCDSDGKVDRFIDRRDVKKVLDLHEQDPGKPYYLAMFLVGAYQEILGDLHNLFGDTTAVHVSLDDAFGYRIDRVVEGDTVNEVLGYVQYEKRDLTLRVRRAAEAAFRSGAITMEESALLLRRFEEGLSGYTYLSPADTGQIVETPRPTEAQEMPVQSQAPEPESTR